MNIDNLKEMYVSDLTEKPELRG